MSVRAISHLVSTRSVEISGVVSGIFLRSMSFRRLAILLALNAACDRPLPSDRVPPGIYVAPPGVSSLAMCADGGPPPCDNDLGGDGGNGGPLCTPTTCKSKLPCFSASCEGDECVATDIPPEHEMCGAKCCPGPAHGSANCNGAGTDCGAPTCDSGYKLCGSACIPENGCCTDAECPGDTDCKNNFCNQSTRVCTFNAINVDQACEGSGTDRCLAHKRCNAGGDCISYPTKVCEWPACRVAPTCDMATGNCGGGTAHLPNGTSCGGTGCYANVASCTDGSCGGQAPKDCSGGVPVCNVGQCIEPSGNCIVVPLDDGAPCTLADKCMVNVACQAGQCRGVVKQCPASDQCHSAYCDPTSGNCVEDNLADGSECSVSDMCMKGGECRGGACVGQPKCVSASQCMVASCNIADGACDEAPRADGTTCQVAGCFEALCDKGVCVCVAQTSAEAEAPPEREGGTLTVVQPKRGCQANEATPLAFMAILGLMLRRRRR